MKKTVVDELVEADEKNYQASKRALDATFLLCQDVFDLYKAMGDGIGKSATAVSEGLIVAIGLQVACTHHLVAACMACMRGTVSNAFVYCRQAIEACAIARICRTDSDAARIWLSSPLHDRKEARQRFSSRQLFPKDDLLLNQLGKDFDLCSTQAHTSLHSTATNLANSFKKGSHDLSFRHCEIEHLGDLLSPFLWIIRVNLEILKVFETVFHSQLDSSWAVAHKEISERVSRHALKHAPTIKARRQWLEERFK